MHVEVSREVTGDIPVQRQVSGVDLRKLVVTDQNALTVSS
jgi:hypothetical protein